MINFSEMFATAGSTFFYGGIIGAGASVLLGIIFFFAFSAEKKRVNKKIESEYSDRNN